PMVKTRSAAFLGRATKVAARRWWHRRSPPAPAQTRRRLAAQLVDQGGEQRRALGHGGAEQVLRLGMAAVADRSHAVPRGRAPGRGEVAVAAAADLDAAQLAETETPG